MITVAPYCIVPRKYEANLRSFVRLNPKHLSLKSGVGRMVLSFSSARPSALALTPLAHHYVSLFPDWQRRVPTVSAYGEALPFPDNSFEVVLSDDVVDDAEDPEAILTEIARVLVPSGMFYFTVNICHPVWNVLSKLRPVEDFHMTHISLGRARRFFKDLPLRIVWESHDIAAKPGRHQKTTGASF